VALALALAAIMGLSWALRAAYLGGPEFAEMLLWKQSAGRIASSFAHARPSWFYVPMVLLLFAPVLMWRPLWIGLRGSFARALDPAQRFLLCWIAPALIGLSLISGKQLHYLLPVVPALALFASLGLKTSAARPSDRFAWLVLAVLLTILLALFASGGSAFLGLDSGVITAEALQLNVPMVLLTGALAAAAILMWGTTLRSMLIGLATANLLLLTSVALQSRAIVTRLFDLQPVADVIGPRRDRPIAVAQRSRGELGFLARLEHPVVYVPTEDIACWLARNPGGLAIVHDKLGRGEPSAKATGGSILYRKDYRSSQVISIVTAPSALAMARPVARASRPCG
jgi:4-amino-4-deoxy-L-arabinose transferase-like glycosyltransferase